MAAFDLALARVQQDSSGLLPDRIDQLARAGNHTFRQTELTPGNTLCLFVRQIACGNIACSAVRHLSDGGDFSDSAWCQARDRLPLELIRQVHRGLIEDARQQLQRSNDVGEQDDYRWRGHRVYVVDGATDTMPDTPQLRGHYGVPGACREGLGFPTSHLMLLMDHRSGLLVDCVDSPLATHDAAVVSQTHRHLQAGDLVLGDDAFGTWAHLALLSQANLHALMPVHHKRIVDFTPGRSHVPHDQAKASHKGKVRSRLVQTLGEQDQIVEYLKPVNQPTWMEAAQWEALPPSITVREIRRTVRRHGFRPITVTIVTTLLDPDAYPADELIELRLTRWMVETNIRHLKVTLGMDQLKCKTVQRVRKERLIFLLVYNLIRILMLHAARRQKVNVNRISFADTLAWLRHGDLRETPALKINPLRPGRLEPRALKGGHRRFPYMTLPRAQLKSQLRARYEDTT